MGIINYAPKILDPIPGGKYVVNAIDYVVNWARANSIWPLTYGTSCCAIEMMSSSMARYDIARFGSEVFRSSPRQADLFILAGTITRRMAPAIQMLWEQIPGPKYAIAMGACTISGGPFIYDNYSVVRGAQNLIPVDVFVPGCPPRPEALFHGLLTLREKILKETCRNPWHEGSPKDVSTMDRYREAAKTWAALEEMKDEEMAEARAKFKEENPDYKSSFKPIRVKKEDFPEVERVPFKRMGLTQSDIYAKLKEKFPAVTVHTHSEDPVEDVVAAMPADRPLEVMVTPEDYLPMVEFIKDEASLKMDYLSLQLKKDFSIPEEQRATALLAHAPSISHLYPAAEFKEREVYDMFGIDFVGHPDQRRIFLDDDFVGYPLRKDFTHPEMIRRPV